MRGLTTVFILIVFLTVCWCAFAPRRKNRFNDAANLPFADEDKHEQTQESQFNAGNGTSESSMNKKRD